MANGDYPVVTETTPRTLHLTHIAMAKKIRVDENTNEEFKDSINRQNQEKNNWQIKKFLI